MNSTDPSKLAWCATFASLFAFETKADIQTAQQVAREAYGRGSGLPASAAVQRMLRTSLTWPGEPAADDTDRRGH
ncbi:MAG TPA: hypothetical protein VIP10_00140 [Burkholderiaceae bacterium]